MAEIQWGWEWWVSRPGPQIYTTRALSWIPCNTGRKVEKDVRVEITHCEQSWFSFKTRRSVILLCWLTIGDIDNGWFRHRRPCFADWQLLCSSFTLSQARLDHFTLKCGGSSPVLCRHTLFYHIVDSIKTRHYWRIEEEKNRVRNGRSCFISLLLKVIWNCDLLRSTYFGSDSSWKVQVNECKWV